MKTNPRLITAIFGLAMLVNLSLWGTPDSYPTDNNSAAKDSISELIAPGAKVEKLADGFAFLEGPVADKKGNLYFTDLRNSRIHIWTVDGELKLFRENTGKANGLYFDKNWNLLVCEGGNRQVTLIDKKGNKTILADKFDGKKLNSPNDLWIDPKGGIYFADPRYGNDDDLELEGFWVFYITPNRKNVVKVIDDLEKPNGILGTPDGKTLYVADRSGNKNWLYDIEPNGRLSNKRFFSEEGSDGMTMDEQENIYISSPRKEPDFAVSVYDASGKKLGEITVPEKPSNMHFGGKDRKTLFITARTSLYSIRMQVKGMKLW